MKRLLGLLLVMGMVGCWGPVDRSKLVKRDGLWYEGDSETPFTGVARGETHRNGQKALELTYKDGVLLLAAAWHEDGQKRMERNFKDGEPEGLDTSWYYNGRKKTEVTYKDGKREGLATWWHGNGQKQAERTFKDGKKVSEKKWDPAGNEIKD